jgi:antirestriction protein ArdC
VDGAEEATEKEVAPISTSVADALAFLEGLGVPVEYGLHDAYYRPDIDKVFMPERTAFDHDLDLVSTLAHEVTHASGHVDRLARETLRDYHKERSIRAREELVAELGASTSWPIWASPIRRGRSCRLPRQLAGCLAPRPKAIFNAAAQAQAAADWIHAAHKAAIAPLAIAA